MPYLIDADWIINALAQRRQADTILAQLVPDGIAVSIVTVGEIYERAYDLPDPDARLALFRGFLAPFQHLGLDEHIIERFAQTRSYLRHRGEIIADFDIIVAATALHHDLTLLTFNLRHFQRIPDLRIYPLPPSPSPGA
jgi:predicted nucleic acid-binding protein